MLSFYKKLSLIVIISSVIYTGSIQAAAARAAAPAPADSGAAELWQKIDHERVEHQFIRKEFAIDPASNLFDFGADRVTEIIDGNKETGHPFTVAMLKENVKVMIFVDEIAEIISKDESETFRILKELVHTYIEKSKVCMTHAMWNKDLDVRSIVYNLQESIMCCTMAIRLIVNIVDNKIIDLQEIDVLHEIELLYEDLLRLNSLYFISCTMVSSRIIAQLGPDRVRHVPKMSDKEKKDTLGKLKKQRDIFDSGMSILNHSGGAHLALLKGCVESAENDLAREVTPRKTIPCASPADQAKALAQHKIECEQALAAEAARIARIELTEKCLG